MFAGSCSLQQHVINVGGLERTYQFHAPRPLPEGPLPLVVALHPFTAQGRSMAYMTGFNALADREGFLVAYPDGLSRSWNYDANAADPRDDVAFIGHMLDDISTRYEIDGTRVFAAGASNGAMMTYRLTCAMPERFAAVGVVMGATIPLALVDDCMSGPPVPVAMIHGTKDRILPYAGGDVFAGPGMVLGLLGVEESFHLWRARNGCTGDIEQTVIAPPGEAEATSVEQWTATGCTNDADVVLYRVVGGGHAWPGGRWIAPRILIGRTTSRLDASEVLWEFFTSHTMK
jgi:polyhydroxybutyrate depolymerase